MIKFHGHTGLLLCLESYLILIELLLDLLWSLVVDWVCTSWSKALARHRLSLGECAAYLLDLKAC